MPPRWCSEKKRTVRAAKGIQETTPLDKFGLFCPLGHPMEVDLQRGVEWRKHHPRGRQYITRGAYVDRLVRLVWLWGSGSRDRPGCSYSGLSLTAQST